MSACPVVNPTATPSVKDARGVALQRSIAYTDLAGCSTTRLVTVEVSVSTVAATSLFPGGKVLATATTKVYVP